MYDTGVRIKEQQHDRDDGTVKFLLELEDGNLIEVSVFEPLPGYPSDLWHVCLSSQVGCALRCGHCATGLRVGYIRDLLVDEILDELRIVWPIVGTRKVQIGFMGMGDAGLVAKNVFGAIGRFDSEFANNSIQTVDVSTIGFVGFVDQYAGVKFGNKFRVGLHFSLMHPDEKERKKLIVSAPTSPREMVMAGAKWAMGQGLRVDFNMVMFKGYNDSAGVAMRLVELFNDSREIYPKGLGPVITIATYNKIEGISWQGLNRTEADNFANKLALIIKEKGMSEWLGVKRFDSAGVKAGAGCGELVGGR